MTYDKFGIGEAPFETVGFNECLYVRQNVAVMPREASGAMVSPTQRFGRATSARTCTGWAQRIQSTYLEFDAVGDQDVIIRFTGPCTRPYVRNVTRGREFFVRAELGEEDLMIVDMQLKRVTINGQMAFGYTGRWFGAKPGDLIQAGASSIGVGFTAEMWMATVNGLITKQVAGHGASEHAVTGRPQVDVSRVGEGVLERAGAGGRNGVGVGKSPRVAAGVAEKDRGY